MHRRKTIVIIMTLLLSLMAGAVLFLQEQWDDFPFTVIVETEGGSETISCWKQIPDTYYVFLPGCADPSQARLRVNRYHPVFVEGEPVRGGTTCDSFPLNVPLQMTYTKRGKTIEQTIVFCKSGRMPVMYLDFVSGSVDYVNEAKTNSEPASMRLYTEDGALACDTGVERVNGRGNSTWTEDKKPYRLKLGAGVDLLGMGEAKEWILLANAYDKSHIRNKLTYDFASEVGAAYTPEARWVELYANGTYLGLYLLTERNEIHPQRVAIPENESFLVSMEWPARISWEQLPSVLSERGNLLRIQGSGVRQARIRQVWQSAENAVYASDGIDPVTGESWEALIDVDSWAEQYLLREIFADGDAGAMSQFFYYSEGDGKLYAGPLWDMDNTLNCWNTQPPNVITAGRRHIWGPDYEPVFYALCRKDAFRERMLQIYYDRFHPMLTRLLSGGIDTYTGQVSQAAAMDALRWDRTVPSQTAQTIGGFLKERMAFLEDYWANPEDYCILEAADEVQWRSYAVRRGETARSLSAIQNVLWYDNVTGEPFALDQPIREDRILRMVEPDA